MAMTKNKDTCKSCLFFVSNENMGVCRRFPVFANHSSNDWCGEWRLEESAALEVMVQQVIEPVVISEPKKQRGRPKNAKTTC